MNNPFDGFRAELNDHNLKEFFVEPSIMKKIIYSPLSSIITGERGSGKSTILSSIKYENKIDELKASKIDYIGIYWKIDLNFSTSFKGKAQTDTEWLDLFNHYASTFFCEKVIRSIIELDKEIINQKEICDLVLEDYFDTEQSLASLDDLHKYLRNKRLSTIKFIRNNCSSEKPISNFGESFRNLISKVMENKFYTNKKFLFLIDEYESLSANLQKIINTYIKYTDKNHSFKICVRPLGFEPDTLSIDEKIKAVHDYDEISITDNDKDYINFVQKICERRLMFYNKKENLELETDISKYLGEFDFASENDYLEENHSPKNLKKKYINRLLLVYNNSEEANKKLMNFKLYDLRYLIFLLDKYPNDIEGIQEIIDNGMSKEKKKDRFNNYSVAIQFLLYKDLKSPNAKIYAGFDKIAAVSGGVVRYFLAICSELFEKMQTDIEERKSLILPIPNEIQSSCVYRISQREYQMVNTIPVYGEAIKNLLTGVGAIFEADHASKKINRIEPNHFNVSVSTSLHVNSVNHIDDKNKKELLQILKYAVIWNILKISNANKKSEKSQVFLFDYSYKIHPIFCPYLKISIRQKKNAVFTAEDLYHISKGNEEIVRKISSRNGEEVKIENLNLFSEEYDYE